MKQKAKIYKGKRIVMGDKNLVTKNEIHVNDIPQEGGESGGGNENTPSTPSRPKWTGHADAEGLKAIGWTDEDIAYYQEHGVNWNAEDDEYHKVSEDNKALYGVLTANNISSYRDRIVYLPKIDTSAETDMSYMFYQCYSLVSIPQLDTQNGKNMSYMFHKCYSLVNIPQLDTSNVTNMSNMFEYCYSLVSISQLDTNNVKNMSNMFNQCYSIVSIPPLNTSSVTSMNSLFNSCNSLVSIPQLDTTNVSNMNHMFYYCHSLVYIPELNTQKVTDMSFMFQDCYSLTSIPQLDTQNVTNMSGMFNACSSLVSIPQLDTAKVTNMSNIFVSCYSLTHAYLKNVKLAYQLNKSELLSKSSLLYTINNEAATSAITIKLAPYAYTRLAEDTDIVAALTAHPNISLSK